VKQILNDFSTAWDTTDSTQSIVSYPEWVISQNQSLIEFDANGYVELTGLSIVVDALYDSIGFTICELHTETVLRFTINDTLTYEFTPDLTYRFYQFYNPYQTITSLKIQSTLATKLFITNLIAYKDDLPFDVHSAIKELVSSKIPRQILIGQGSGVSGGKTLTVATIPKFIERLSVIQIGNEKHQIESINIKPSSYELVFNENYNGKTLLNTYTNANLYLSIPVLVEPKNIEGVTPALSLEQGFDYTKNNQYTFAKSEIVCKDLQGNIYERKISGQYDFKPILHGLYRSLETKQLVSEIFSYLAGNNYAIYINDKRHILLSGQIQDMAFDDGTGEMQLLFTLLVGVHEWETVYTPNDLTIQNITTSQE